jgi:hypothetical protein
MLIIDGEAMGDSHDKFVQLKKDGKLLSPDMVGNAIGGLSVCRNDNLHKFSGKFINWNDETIIEFYKEM